MMFCHDTQDAVIVDPVEYHGLSLLAPDGRVITTSGTSNQAVGPTNNNDVEAYAPPYLFRGPRPRIDSVSTADFENGGKRESPHALSTTAAEPGPRSPCVPPAVPFFPVPSAYARTFG
jgi:hypothetical protein